MFCTRRALLLVGVVAGWALSPAGAGAADFINVLTGGQAGVYYPLGVAVEKLFAANIKDAKPSTQATKASVENLQLLQDGKGEIAFALGDSVQFAVQGNEEAGFPKKLDKLRSIAAIYPNYIQIVASKESGIKSLTDLKGKRLSVGAPRSGTELNTRAILAAAGMSYKDLAKVEYLDFAASVDLIKNRQLDATLQSAGLGVASIRDLATSIDTVVVEVPASIVSKVGSPYASAPIPAKTYPGQDAAVNTAIIPNYLITRSDLSADAVYAMTKAIFDNLPALVAAHAAAKDIKLEDAPKNLPVPLHPGAERYFKEKKLM
jgi:TRAP transporter TAXI family solute receptor